MANLQRWLLVAVAVAWSTGCVSAPVQRGALIGALSGAAVGSGLGFMVTEEDLLGSPTSKDSGDLSLEKGGTILAGLSVGVVFGALVGAMIGHGNDTGEEEADAPATPAAPTAQRVAPAAF